MRHRAEQPQHCTPSSAALQVPRRAYSSYVRQCKNSRVDRLGTPGYTGLDPYTGLPTPLTGQLPVEPVSGYVQIVGDVSLTPGDTLTITVNPSGGGGYLNVRHSRPFIRD